MACLKQRSFLPYTHPRANFLVMQPDRMRNCSSQYQRRLQCRAHQLLASIGRHRCRNYPSRMLLLFYNHCTSSQQSTACTHRYLQALYQKSNTAIRKLLCFQQAQRENPARNQLVLRSVRLAHRQHTPVLAHSVISQLEIPNGCAHHTAMVDSNAWQMFFPLCLQN